MSITIQDLIARHRNDTLAKHVGAPDGYALDVTIDKGRAIFKFHPGWDDDGEERDGDPLYLDVEPSNGPDQIQALLGILGVEADHA